MLYSIIVPVHNSESTIRKCVECLCEQDEPTQIILIENGSNDDSLVVCWEMERSYSNVEVYINNELGVSSARNVGLSKANGEIIGFCDADDFYEKNILGKISYLFKETKTDIIITAHNLCCNNEIIPRKSKIEKRVNTSQAIDNILCNPVIMGSVWNKFFKRESITDCLFPTDLTHLEDGFFNTMVLSTHRNVKVYISKIITYNYVISQYSATYSEDKSFDQEGNLKYNIALYKMIDELLLNHSEIDSVKDKIYQLSTMWYYDDRIGKHDMRKAKLLNGIRDNLFVFLKRLLRYDFMHRIKLLIKGLFAIKRF